MAISRKQFIAFLEKTAQDATELDKNDQVKGEQEEAVPTLLQPDDGPSKGERGAEEAMSDSAERIHEDNREGGYLQNAFAEFAPSSKEVGSQLGELLDNFGPKAGASKPQTIVGKDKTSSVRAAAFLDELNKISGR